MLACDVSVTTACAWAKSKRTPSAASRSSAGVRARPPYVPKASARIVSMVISRTFCRATGFSVTGDDREHAATAHADTTQISAMADGWLMTERHGSWLIADGRLIAGHRRPFTIVC